MCEQCVTDICLVFDGLVDSFWRDFPPALEDEPRRRPKYMTMDVQSGPRVSPDYANLAELISRSSGIGFQGWEFKAELAKRSGFAKQIEAWASGAKVPNGLARKVILSCAEDILLERGARPTRTLRAA